MDTPSLSEILNALRDPTRRRILLRLEAQERPCFSFADLGSKTSLSYHFAVLRQAGLTRARREGTSLFLSICREEIESAYPGLLQAILDGERREGLIATDSHA
jgi:DNA-binding transcriptional ArsR family regulator